MYMDQSTAADEKLEGKAVIVEGAAGDEQMADVDMTAKGLEEFLATGRTGRRNALADIGDEVTAGLSTADLPLDMAKLSCAENSSNQSGCSSTSPQNPSPGAQPS